MGILASVLVVEDNSVDMELVTCILELNGLEVTQAVNGLDALEEIYTSKFDLILLDIRLPDINGLDFLKKIPISYNVPVIALTAYAMKGDKEFFINAGCDGYISKPIFITQFIETIYSFLDQNKSGL